MNPDSRKIQTIYLVLLLLHTLAASFIWGINTLFLLDAGLTNAHAFAANAFFTAGLVLFEVPTGVIADTRGRRFSYLLGTLTLTVATLLYLWMWRMHAPFWAWAVTSAFLGLGFTFFSGAVQAWLVDALKHSGYEGKMDAVFARGEIVEGIAMLTGSVAGGYIAQATNLGVPYLVRGVILAAGFVLAFLLMKDVGFEPRRGGRLADEMKTVFRSGVRYGWGTRPIRWLMLGAIFTDGVMIYAFYAMQPYLLELYGKPKAYGVAGLAAAIVAGAQIAGGLLVPYLGRIYHRRTAILLTGTIVSVAVLAAIGLFPRFYVAVVLLVLWALMFAAVTPVRQAYLNGLIPSEQRATVLSLDSMFASGGGVVIQPILGRAADAWSYPASYLCSAAIQALAIPFVWLARREGAESDPIEGEPGKA
ncbi:MAG TPA: MFS transporter [Thermoanaerobaculia bacterium]|nr:MFS transporter [Thermoanaerobaculia bacterium]